MVIITRVLPNINQICCGGLVNSDACIVWVSTDLFDKVVDPSERLTEL